MNIKVLKEKQIVNCINKNKRVVIFGKQKMKKQIKLLEVAFDIVSYFQSVCASE